MWFLGQRRGKYSVSNRNPHLRMSLVNPGSILSNSELKYFQGLKRWNLLLNSGKIDFEADYSILKNISDRMNSYFLNSTHLSKEESEAVAFRRLDEASIIGNFSSGRS